MYSISWDWGASQAKTAVLSRNQPLGSQQSIVVRLVWCFRIYDFYD